MPPLHSTAAILSVGDELTLGQGLDTNSEWLSRRLVDFGIVPVHHATVPDHLPAISGRDRGVAVVRQVFSPLAAFSRIRGRIGW
jgi:molybdopterin-biosynthesis enzyme MoeA-like protein